ncbi:hypothetical protein BFL43_04250 [Williamsia sp. 1135]|nr:hypothetical protein BFL43_04250 [Williamsia sp. 1135]
MGWISAQRGREDAVAGTRLMPVIQLRVGSLIDPIRLKMSRARSALSISSNDSMCETRLRLSDTQIRKLGTEFVAQLKKRQALV